MSAGFLKLNILLTSSVPYILLQFHNSRCRRQVELDGLLSHWQRVLYRYYYLHLDWKLR